MQLIKFCHPQHNINGGAKLKLGTLFGYREIENAELRDEAEGSYQFTIEFPNPIELDHRWANLLFQGMFQFGSNEDVPRFPGSYSAHAETLNIVEVKRNSVVIANARLLVHRSVNNSLTFCMSQFDSAESNPFTTYEDHWGFPKQKGAEFANRLGRLIFGNLKLSHFDESILAKHSAATIKNLSLQVRHKQVIYRDRHLRVTEANQPSYEELLDVLSNVAFVKPLKFSSENEYRFVFDLVDGDTIFPCKKEDVLLTLNPLLDL